MNVFSQYDINYDNVVLDGVTVPKPRSISSEHWDEFWWQLGEGYYQTAPEDFGITLDIDPTSVNIEGVVVPKPTGCTIEDWENFWKCPGEFEDEDDW